MPRSKISGAATMHDIAKSAMTFVNQANKYSDCRVFKAAEAFEVLFAAIESFDGGHLQSARKRKHFFEAINMALSTILRSWATWGFACQFQSFNGTGC